MNIKSILFVIFSLAMFAPASNAQDGTELNFCGTPPVKSEWLTNFQQNGILYRTTNDWLLVPLTIHILGSDSGEGYYTTKSILDALCTLNADFAQVKVRFFIKGSINYIPNSAFNDHTLAQGRDMMLRYSVSNTINSYIVQSAAGNCGYASIPLGVALSKSCMKEKDHTWAHEIGHFFSLPHTFHHWEGQTPNFSIPAPFKVGNTIVERVDGVSCQVAGDGFCDTPPDYLDFRWTCNAQRKSDQVQIDPTGVSFVSDGSLFMSYANDACMDKFSPLQIAAMRANLKSVKPNYLANASDTTRPVVTKLVALSPAEGSIINNYKQVTLSWEAMPKATHYQVEIASFPEFPFILFRYIVNGTSISTGDLFRNRNYYWRVRPFNAWSECTPPVSSSAFFQTADLVDVKAIEALTDLQLFPNPIQSGKTLRVSISAMESLKLEARLLSLTGQQLQRHSWTLVPGQNDFTLHTGQLPAGIYLLRLASMEGVVTRRVVVGKW